MTEERQRRRRATPEQLRAREELAEARRKKLERKRRTRGLIQMGGVLAAYGFETPEQVEEHLEKLLGSRNGPAHLLRLGVRPTERWPRGAP